MRLTGLTHIGQVKDRYIALRSDGYDRDTATREILGVLEHLTPEERLTFCVGLADGQFARKELTLPVAIQGFLALHRLKMHSRNITPGDFERRRKHYSLAPMPERKVGRPPKKA